MKKYKWINSAILEFVVNMAISTLPFSVTILVVTLSSKINLDPSGALLKITKNGELAIYSATLMAPLMYAIMKDPPVNFKAAFALFGGGAIISGVLTYAIGIMDGFTDKIHNFSIAFFSAAVIVYLVFILVQQEFESRRSAPEIQTDTVSNSLKGYKEHRGVKP